MKAKENFEDKLHERFKDFSVPLRDSQWDKMESALLNKKSTKKRWWIMLSALLLVGILSFSAGYMLKNKKKELSVNKSQEEATIPSLDDSNKASQGVKESNGNNRIELNNQNELAQAEVETSNSTSEIKMEKNETENKRSSVAKINPESPVSYTTNSKILDKVIDLPREKVINTKPSDNMNASNSTKQLFALNSVARWNANVSSVKLLRLPLEYKEMNDWPPLRINNRKEHFLNSIKSGYSLELTAGTFNRNASIIPGNDDSSYLSRLPGLTESVDKQVAKGNGFRLGFGIRKNLYKGLSLSSGIIYNKLSEKNSFEQIHNYVPFYDSSTQVILGYITYDDSLAPRSQVSINNSISYLQVPIRFRYDKAISTNFRVGVSAGYAFNVPLKMDFSYYNIFQFKYEKLDKDMLQLGAQTQFGLHLDYKLYKQVWLGLNYAFANSTNKLTLFNNQVDLRNKSNQVNLGLSIKL